MSRLDRALTVVENVVAAGALALAVLIAIVSVLLRAVFGVFLSWTEEAIVYLIIYSTFIGAVITLRHNEHVNVDLMALLAGRRGRRIVHTIGAFVTVVYLGAIGYFSWLLLLEPFSTATVTPSLKLPLWVLELSVPIGLTLMFIRGVEILYRVARGQVAFSEGEKSALQHEAEQAGVDLERGPDGESRDNGEKEGGR
ncbi:MAG: TRAP transporter small permease subunit [Streptosporangiales bacterium]|nr:TRAP transporter small permease subunit [Streptosporangiales bacterium]